MSTTLFLFAVISFKIYDVKDIFMSGKNALVSLLFHPVHICCPFYMYCVQCTSGVRILVLHAKCTLCNFLYKVTSTGVVYQRDCKLIIMLASLQAVLSWIVFQWLFSKRSSFLLQSNEFMVVNLNFM